ncbi:MAG: hypothetical protein ACE5J4_00005 [Candidatus Aenigmatarchaeota archaeon]
MCLLQKGKIIKINRENVIVLVNGKEKEVRVKGKVKIGDEINIFQSLGFK